MRYSYSLIVAFSLIVAPITVQASKWSLRTVTKRIGRHGKKILLKGKRIHAKRKYNKERNMAAVENSRKRSAEAVLEKAESHAAKMETTYFELLDKREAKQTVVFDINRRSGADAHVKRRINEKYELGTGRDAVVEGFMMRNWALESIEHIDAELNTLRPRYNRAKDKRDNAKLDHEAYSNFAKTQQRRVDRAKTTLDALNKQLGAL